MSQELNKYSKTITQDMTLPASQAMLYGIGLTEYDLKKAQVGIVSTGYDGNTCNMHLNALASEVKQAVWDQELVGWHGRHALFAREPRSDCRLH